MTRKNKCQNFKQNIPLQNYVCMGVITNTVTGETQNLFIPAQRVFKSAHVECTPSTKN